MSKKITFVGEIEVIVYDDTDMIGLKKSILEESKNCWGVGSENYSYDVKRFKNLKIKRTSNEV